MEDKLANNNWTTRKNAKLLYSKIGHIWCPTLNDDVAFNRMGFQHLIRKHGFPRPRHEQNRRLHLLPFAENILADPLIKPVYQKQLSSYSSNRHGEKIKGSPIAEFWRFSKKEGNKSINVIVRKLNNGEKHFFSIY